MGAGTTSLIGKGLDNTNLLNTISGGDAVWTCYDKETGGYTDWFLPSSGELKAMLSFIYEGVFSSGMGCWSSNNNEYISRNDGKIYSIYQDFQYAINCVRAARYF